MKTSRFPESLTHIKMWGELVSRSKLMLLCSTERRLAPKGITRVQEAVLDAEVAKARIHLRITTKL